VECGHQGVEWNVSQNSNHSIEKLFCSLEFRPLERRRVAFPVTLDMTLLAVQTENGYPYQLAAVIPHLGNPEKDQGHYMTFLRIFGQWIGFNDTEVEAVEESPALHENFPETEGSPQTATILLYVAHN
jgi:hypothetical protein